MKLSGMVSGLLFIFPLVAACGPAAAPAAPDYVAFPTPAGIKSGEAWQQKWDALVEAGKKEGRVVVFTNIGGQIRADLTRAVKEKYGIELEFMVASRGLELTQRMVTERRAGLYTADVVVTGATTFITTMKPENLLAPIPPVLVLPEALDPKAWRGGAPFIDKDRTLAALIAYYNRYLARNTEMVKEGELTSYRDVLNPKWKGKIVMNDPSISGSANSFMGLLVKTWGLEPTKEFLRELVKQGPTITRDRRLQVEGLARGKYALSLASSAEPVAEFMGIGSPIAYVKVKEGGSVTASSGVITIPVRMAHPNAAAVFVNWLLTKEGMTVFSRGFGQPSSRLDVPAVAKEGYWPPEPGETVILEDEEDILAKEGLMAVGRDIFAPLLK
ncbi:MAG: extracellular solute-binding protein [Chloroflexi bacterium]|nr:extracellular solute-binding protein [Chloroflexota bacterium]